MATLAERHVPPHEVGLLHGGDKLEVFRQHGSRIRPRHLVPGMHHDRERQSQFRDAQRVVAVLRALGLLRVVAELRLLLVLAAKLRRTESHDMNFPTPNSSTVAASHLRSGSSSCSRFSGFGNSSATWIYSLPGARFTTKSISCCLPETVTTRRRPDTLLH